mmetsp:Transcript_11074/g.12678  ORF Transcript_11074/g.12678 Transcript_11074/m.12678 type:complete len:231 (-) Transcript_11074:3424-4116(-)
MVVLRETSMICYLHQRIVYNHNLQQIHLLLLQQPQPQQRRFLVVVVDLELLIDGMKEVTRFQINVKDGAKSLVFKTLEVHENGLRNALNTDHIHSYITETVNQMGGHIVIGGLTLLIDLIPEVRVKAINRQVVDAMVSLGVLTMVAKNTMIDTIVLELAAHTKEIITGGIDLHNMIQRDTVTNTMIVDEMNIIVILGVQIICSRLEKVGKAAAKILNCNLSIKMCLVQRD